jgi:hypothetical protein
VQVNREHLQVLAPQPRLVAGLIILNLGGVLEDYDLTILQVQLVVLHSCLQLDHLGAIGYHTVVHGVDDITPDSLREIVLVGVIHGVLNFGGLDGEFERGSNHHVLKWTGIISEGIVRERKEHRLVECTHICVKHTQLEHLCVEVSHQAVLENDSILHDVHVGDIAEAWYFFLSEHTRVLSGAVAAGMVS